MRTFKSKSIIFKGIGLAMGVAVFVLNILEASSIKTYLTLLSLGLIGLSLASLEEKTND